MLALLLVAVAASFALVGCGCTTRDNNANGTGGQVTDGQTNGGVIAGENGTTAGNGADNAQNGTNGTNGTVNGNDHDTVTGDAGNAVGDVVNGAGNAVGDVVGGVENAVDDVVDGSRTAGGTTYNGVSGTPRTSTAIRNR